MNPSALFLLQALFSAIRETVCTLILCGHKFLQFVRGKWGVTLLQHVGKGWPHETSCKDTDILEVCY